MYKLDLPVDMKETAAIQRRRNAELQRQSRIFNARVRVGRLSPWFCPMTGDKYTPLVWNEVHSEEVLVSTLLRSVVNRDISEWLN